VNASKSECILFTKRKKFEAPLSIMFNGAIVSVSKSVKYLGVTLQSNLKFNEHCSNVLKKAKEVNKKNSGNLLDHRAH